MQQTSRSEQEALGWQDKVSERRMDTLSGSYSSLYLGNPLTYLFNSTLCYVVSGVAILVVGVIITSVTFQNLDPLHEGNKQRYAGPVLMGAGILVMGRGAFWKLKQLDCRATLNRQRNLWRRICNRQHEEDSEAAAIYLEPTDPEDFDDPPSYAQVTSQLSGTGPSVLPAAVLADHYGAIANPALDTGDEEDPLDQPPPLQVYQHPIPPLQPVPPPPPYEEVRHIRQTRI